MADNLQVTEGSSSKYVRSIEKTATIHTSLTAVDIGSGTTETRLVAGQAAAAASIPVVLASDQASITNISTGADAVAAPTVAINVASFTLLRNRTDNDFDRATVAAADALAVTGVLATAGMMWNGTTYDRPRGDTTNGLDVDVTRVSGVAPAFGSGVRGSTVQRVTIATDDVVPTSQSGTWTVGLSAGTANIGDVDVLTMAHGKTIATVSGLKSTSGDTTLVTPTNKGKVFAFSLTTTTTTATIVKFTSGAGGTELWRVKLVAPTGGMAGANLAVPVPAWIFSTTTNGHALVLNTDQAVDIHYAVSYVDEA